MWLYLSVSEYFFVCCSFFSLPKCKPNVVGVLIFLFLIISLMHVRLSFFVRNS